MPSKSNKRNLNAAPPTASASRRSNADDHHRPGGGDDLDENFLLDANVTLADSSDEESLQEDDDTSTALVEEAPAVTKPEPPRNGPTVPSTSDNATPDKKRKRPAEEDGKAKVRGRDSERERERPYLALELSSLPLTCQKRKTDGGGGNGLTPNKDRDTAGNPASQPPAIIAQYIVSAQKRTFRGISQMELEGMLIPGEYSQSHARACWIDTNPSISDGLLSSTWHSVSLTRPFPFGVGIGIAEPAIVDTTSYNGSRDLGSLPEFFRQGASASPPGPVHVRAHDLERTIPGSLNPLMLGNFSISSDATLALPAHAEPKTLRSAHGTGHRRRRHARRRPRQELSTPPRSQRRAGRQGMSLDPTSYRELYMHERIRPLSISSSPSTSSSKNKSTSSIRPKSASRSAPRIASGSFLQVKVNLHARHE